jgi:hypothetical protein
MLAWMEQNKELLVWVSVASAVFFVASLVIVGVVIVQLPADHFRKSEQSRKKAIEKWVGQNPAMLVALRIVRNVVGWVLILAGLAMLVLPGQGMLVLLIGIMLADFPGKHRVERWVISREKVLKTINWLRKKFRRPALQPAVA